MVIDERPVHPQSAFEFTGTWRDYAPIALSNFFLTIITLGFYRFWAIARERRYLWSHSRFIDDQLEWTGTGKEMFIGFLFVMAILALPILFLQFGFQAMILRGHGLAAGLMLVGLYVFLLYLAGFARFRMLRYRLSRTWWHGIRGGSDESGLHYGWSAIWKPIAGSMFFGALIPRAMVSLWRERWNAMSFGGTEFTSSASVTSALFWRWIIVLVSPLIALAIIGGIAASTGLVNPQGNEEKFSVIGIFYLIATYSLIALIGIGYYAAFFREVICTLNLGGLDFAFNARSKDWLKLFFGDVGLVIVTLGIGWAFLGYRHWSFFIRHMEAYGEVNLDQLTQSTTRMQREAEGFADAFDIGAF